MSRLKYCTCCQRQVQPKKVNKLLFIILLWCAIVPALLYWAICGGNKCPICGYKF